MRVYLIFFFYLFFFVYLICLMRVYLSTRRYQSAVMFDVFEGDFNCSPARSPSNSRAPIVADFPVWCFLPAFFWSILMF